MKYFKIDISDDLSLIGFYPQIEKDEDYNLSAPNSYWNVTWDKLPDFNPEYKIRISENANSTNLLSNLSGFCGLTVDADLKCLIENYNLPKHRFYPVQVRHLNQELNYYWLHFVNSFLEFVDFKNSTFELFRKSPFQILKEFKVSSVVELHYEEDKLNFEMDIRVKKIVVKQNFPDYDIISLRNIAPFYLVSEKLKLALEKSNLNGFVFNEYKPLCTAQKQV